MSRDALQLLREYPNWTQSFTGPVLQRGERYAQEDRVEIEHCSGPLIEATCRGSEGSPYRQKITLTALAGRCHVRGQCSCPVGQNCKHCAAALFVLSETPAAAKMAIPCQPTCNAGSKASSNPRWSLPKCRTSAGAWSATSSG